MEVDPAENRTNTVQDAGWGLNFTPQLHLKTAMMGSTCHSLIEKYVSITT